jgi:hypothetical protein
MRPRERVGRTVGVSQALAWRAFSPQVMSQQPYGRAKRGLLDCGQRLPPSGTGGLPRPAKELPRPAKELPGPADLEGCRLL